MTSDILTQKLCDRLRNLCLNNLIEAELKNCWTKALASKVAYSYLRDIYIQHKLTRICLKKIHTDTHTKSDSHELPLLRDTYTVTAAPGQTEEAATRAARGTAAEAEGRERSAQGYLTMVKASSHQKHDSLQSVGL